MRNLIHNHALAFLQLDCYRGGKMESDQTAPNTCVIRKLYIERFRGIERLTWRPAAGVNVILGGGDVGKTTLLEAIALLFSPATSQVLTDADYYNRTVTAGFRIEAVVTMPDRAGINTQAKMALPWEWNGEEAAIIDIDDANAVVANDPVYRVQVRGTEDLDLAYEIVQPDDQTVVTFNVSIRRAIGLVRLSGDDRNDRDLRLLQGSALDRLLGDSKLRAKVGLQLAGVEVADGLSASAKDVLASLDSVFEEHALPHALSLGITSPQGISLNALIGLTASKGDVQLPFASWGSGTRRLAALEIAALSQSDTSLVVVDEVERGLEPYRQRAIVRDLQAGGSQVFLTTHSAAVLQAAGDATFWHLGRSGVMGQVSARATAHRLRNPEAYLARLAIVAEGATELGFLDAILRRHLRVDLLDVGIVLSNGGGNDDTLTILEALTQSELQFAGFADDEGRDPLRWQRVKDRLGPLLFRWPSACIEANIVPLVADGDVEAFITPPDGNVGDRLRTLQERLRAADKAFDTIRAAAPDLHALIVEASTNLLPDDEALSERERKTWKKHGSYWFKSIGGGKELADKVFTLGLWPKLAPQLNPFIVAVAATVGAAPKGPLPV